MEERRGPAACLNPLSVISHDRIRKEKECLIGDAGNRWHPNQADLLWFLCCQERSVISLCVCHCPFTVKLVMAFFISG